MQLVAVLLQFLFSLTRFFCVKLYSPFQLLPLPTLWLFSNSNTKSESIVVCKHLALSCSVLFSVFINVIVNSAVMPAV